MRSAMNTPASSPFATPSPRTEEPQRPELPLRAEPLQVTINEAARLLAYDARTIRRLIIRGELRAVGQGRLRRIPMQSLHDYQQRHLTASPAS
jgi:excisionase family DNA binding protein